MKPPWKGAVRRKSLLGDYMVWGDPLPKRRSRHIKSQMRFFSRAKPVRRGRLLVWR